jgi:hypothetical protein
MGNKSSKTKKKGNKRNDFYTIQDNFETVEEVQDELRKSGMEMCDLIIGIDYTQSNTWNGKNTYYGRNLHFLDSDMGMGMNPYQHVIQTIGKTLAAFDADQKIPVFGFGDNVSRGHSIFSLNPQDTVNGICHTFNDVIDKYNRMTPLIKLGGPTNFAPIIRKSIEIVTKEKSFHILIIIADGEVSRTSKQETINAIIEASYYPLSIIMIGVGDGGGDNFETMKKFDDELPQRKFDNFQFVNYEEMKKIISPEYFEARFALCSLMEVPEQYKYLQKKGLVD